MTPNESTSTPEQQLATILVIDDDTSIRVVTQRLLEHLGYAVITAVDGHSAITILQAAPLSIDCALLDLTMPGMRGIDVADRLRQIRANLPIILMSGYYGEPLQLAGDPRHTHFLGKPFAIDELRRVLQAALNS
jgi:CheY-like chemotaxis protein